MTTFTSANSRLSYAWQGNRLTPDVDWAKRQRRPTRAAPRTGQARRSVCLFAGATRRQVVADVLMVAAWAVAIPGLLWFGHWMGF